MTQVSTAADVTVKQPRFNLYRELIVPAKLADVFKFFSDAHNLDRITPKFLRFQVLTPAPIAMKEGARIEYALRLRGIPIRWTSEITVWEPPYRFVDTQIKGPYRSWIHEHRFEELGSDTKVIDEVAYDFFGGHLVHALFIRRDIAHIFDHRSESLKQIFGKLDCDSRNSV